MRRKGHDPDDHPWLWPLLVGGALIGAALLSHPAHSAPPPGVGKEGPIAAWFSGLVREDGVHCCGVGDCRRALPGEIKVENGTFYVHINGDWQPVPSKYIVHRDYNPLDVTIICRTRYLPDQHMHDTLYCVIPYTGF